MVSQKQPVTDMVDALETASERPRPTIASLLNEVGGASFAATLLILSLMLFSPLSGIPLFTTISGMLIATIAGQAVWGRERVWVPDFLGRVALDGDRVQRAIDVVRSFADWIDNKTRPRLGAIVAGPALIGLYALIAVLAVCLPFLEFVPFASSLFGLGVLLISIGIIVRDGVIAIFGVILLPLGFALPAILVSFLVT